jgi:transcriptional regulator with XRE-family HTH domain
MFIRGGEMGELTEKNIEWAYLTWKHRYDHADELVDEYLAIEKQPKGVAWLKIARKAKLLSKKEMARRLEISPSAYNDMEERESLGHATIASLQKAAEALGCDLIYALRPKERKAFSRLLWETVLPAVTHHPYLKTCRKGSEANVLHALAERKMNEPSFRQKNQWSRNQMSERPARGFLS